MEEASGVNTQVVLLLLKAARLTARRMVAASGARLRTASSPP